MKNKMMMAIGVLNILGFNGWAMAIENRISPKQDHEAAIQKVLVALKQEGARPECGSTCEKACRKKCVYL